MPQTKGPKYGSTRFLTATRFRSPAQGCRFGYPGDHGWNIIQPQSGCVISSTNQKRAQPPCGWESTKFVT